MPRGRASQKLKAAQSRGNMKYVLLILAVFGMVVAALALREHYREYGDSPCSINEHWDCGVVNHSKYALVGGAVPALKTVPGLGALPLATAEIIGHLVMAAKAWFFSRSSRDWRRATSKRSA